MVGFNYFFFDFTMVQKGYTLSRNHTSNFELRFFPVYTHSHDVGQQHKKPQLPVSHTITKVNHQYT